MENIKVIDIFIYICCEAFFMLGIVLPLEVVKVNQSASHQYRVLFRHEVLSKYVKKYTNSERSGSWCLGLGQT